MISVEVTGLHIAVAGMASNPNSTQMSPVNASVGGLANCV